MLLLLQLLHLNFRNISSSSSKISSTSFFHSSHLNTLFPSSNQLRVAFVYKCWLNCWRSRTGKHGISRSTHVSHRGSECCTQCIPCAHRPTQTQPADPRPLSSRTAGGWENIPPAVCCFYFSSSFSA